MPKDKAIDADPEFCSAVIVVDCVPSSAEVSACAVWIAKVVFPPEKLWNTALNIELLDVTGPRNTVLSFVVTLAVAITVSAAKLSGIVALAGESEIDVGTAGDPSAGLVVCIQLPLLLW